jgi:hypothetical protein
MIDHWGIPPSNTEKAIFVIKNYVFRNPWIEVYHDKKRTYRCIISDSLIICTTAALFSWTGFKKKDPNSKLFHKNVLRKLVLSSSRVPGSGTEFQGQGREAKGFISFSLSISITSIYSLLNINYN